MVLLLKPSGDVHIFVNLADLKRVIGMEIHPVSSVDQCLAQPGETIAFTKLDGNGEYRQINLCKMVRLKTTLSALLHVLF